MTGSTTELVILVDETGNAVGTTPKATVHHTSTPLHLAFSCYLFDHRGRLLLTRRALHKPTWPGSWTNSFCGHPGPGEEMAEAVRRRAEQELGTTVERLQLTLPTFRYEATMPNGVRENELCPVFTAVASGDVRPDPDEVDSLEWVDWVTFRDEVLAGTREVSPWCVEQVAALATAQEGEDADGPPRFAEASVDRLPAAARPGG
jgi:isopentenyl-diphosphate delta-isomerase